MNSKMKKIVALLFMVVLFSSCKEEEILTSGEKTGIEVKDQTESLQIETALIYSWYGSFPWNLENEGSFDISGQYIMVDASPQVNNYYNLDKLYRYRIYEDRKEIHLFFK